MIVYHGSNSCFQKLRIHKDLVKSSGTLLNEGMGIYFSLDKEVCKSYGKYLYTLEINNNSLIDFRSKAECRKYILQIAKVVNSMTKIDILNYFNAQGVIDYLYLGNTAISGAGREIQLLLDSNENWYCKNTESQIEKVYKILDNFDKKYLNAYLFNYNIKDVGVIKKVDPNVVRILRREKVY